MKEFELARAYDLLHLHLKGKGIEDDGEGGYALLLKICAAAVERGSADRVIEQQKECTPIRAWYDIRELLDDNRMEEQGVYEVVRDAVHFCIDILDLPEDGEELDFGED